MQETSATPISTPSTPTSTSWEKLDKPTFFGVLILLTLATVPLMLWPEQGAIWVEQAKMFLTDELGLLYLVIGVAAVGFMVFIVFSDIGQIKLGDADEPVEFKTMSWAAMLFCGGIGASILYWSMIEWAFYYQNPPFQLAVGSEEAIRWSATYGIFHWGIIAWSIYLVPALPISYFFYIRNQPILKISHASTPVIGEECAAGWLGKLIDMLFIFGLLGGGATTLGLAAPLINDGLSVLFGFPSTTFSQIMVLLVCTSIFAYSAYAGLEKGIQMLSNINLWGALILLGFVLVAGPTVFLLETGFDALGRMLSNFFVMATWAEPFGGLPLLVICVLLIMSIVRVAYLDLFFQEDYENSIINISSFPDYDPWSNEGIALAKFEQLKDEVIALVANEHDLKEDIKALQKQMRAEALRSSKAGIYDDSVTSALRVEMNGLMKTLDKSNKIKQEKLQEAKAAKTVFDEMVAMAAANAEPS